MRFFNRNIPQKPVLIGGGLIVIVGLFFLFRLLIIILSGPYSILIDGEPIVTVESRKAVTEVLSSVRERHGKNLPSDVIKFAEKVRFRPNFNPDELADITEAIGAVQSQTTVQAQLYTIMLNEEPYVAFAKREDAEETLKLLKRHYERMIEGIHTESRFKEKVHIELTHVDLQLLSQSVQEALRKLTVPDEGDTYHTVVRGDRVSNIATKYRVSFSDIKRLNPGLNLDRIIEGDQILIKTARPPVTVISEGTVTRTIEVTPPPGAGRQARVGEREIRVRLTFENGVLVSEDILGQITTWDAN